MRHKYKAFGIIEVLIASSVIAMVLATMLVTTRSALTSGEKLTEREQAVFLAQEGLEIVRNIRDSNWSDGDNATAWNKVKLGAAPAAGACFKTDYNANYIFNSIPKPRFFLIAISNCDNWSSAETAQTMIDGTQYKRMVKIDTVGSLMPTNSAQNDVQKGANAMKVTVIIRNSADTRNLVTLSEILTNWK